METLKEQIEKEVENKSAQFRLCTIKKYIPTFIVKASYRQVVSRAWDNVTGNRYKYTIEIGKTDGRRFTFVFYDSINSYKTNKRLNIFDVIYSMVLDYTSYEYANNLIDFVEEFGYDTDDKEQVAQAKQAFNGCKSIYTKASKVFSSNELEVLKGACSQY